MRFLVLASLLLLGCLGQVTCEKPYIKVGSSCCLDSDSNSICDSDELNVVEANAKVAEANSDVEEGDSRMDSGRAAMEDGRFADAIERYTEARLSYESALSGFRQACRLSSAHCFNGTGILSSCHIPIADLNADLASLYVLSSYCSGPDCSQMASSDCNRLLDESRELDEACGFDVSGGMEEACSSLSKPKEYSVFIDALPSGVDGDYAGALRDAFDYWEAGENVSFREVQSMQEAWLTISWVKEFGGEPVGITTGSRYVQIGLGDSLCLEKWRPYKRESVLLIAEHELGHVLGYGHDADPKNIMHPVLPVEYEIDLNESSFLPDGASVFFPVCTRNDAAEYSFTVTSDVPLDIYVVPSVDDFDDFVDGKDFSYYSGCDAEGTEDYAKKCSIPQGSGIILYNPSVFGKGEDAQYTLTAKEG